MSSDWRLLGEGVIVQAVPRLVRKHRVRANLPDKHSLYGSSLEHFVSLYRQYETILRRLFEECRVSWKEVYMNSDVGMERMQLAEKMHIGSNDDVLDVGCGRGFFTMAAAHYTKHVVGIDLMDGLGRIGWWKRFKATSNEFNQRGKVSGVRGTASVMPFGDEVFSVVASVHAVRNFQEIKIVQDAFQEMKRITKRGGRVFFVEDLPIAKTRAQKAHLMMFGCKVKYTSGEMPYFAERELTDLIERAGFSRLSTKILDSGLSAAPPFFFLNASTLQEKQRKKAEEEYNGAVEAVRKWGEASPPALFVEAVVE